MIRKVLAALVIAAAGLFAVAGVAAAAPVTSYSPDGSVTIVASDDVVTTNGVVAFSGSGFVPGETISVVITYSGPSGLRGNQGVAFAKLAAPGMTTTADGSGNFASNLNLTQAGTATITATGMTSGKTATLKVTILAPGATTPAPSTTTVGAPTTSGTSAAAVAGGASGGDGGGLASTGVSIAGPLTVGAAALLLGLGMLFFGTRLAIRRKQHSPRV